MQNTQPRAPQAGAALADNMPSTSSVLLTSAKNCTNVTKAARCSASERAALASDTITVLKPAIMASRAEASQHTLVKVPAINTVSTNRATIGSFMKNTLESNVRALGVAKENLAATESSIREVDVAQEMTNYTKLQILQQSGMSMLAQANSAPQSVLSLLR